MNVIAWKKVFICFEALCMLLSVTVHSLTMHESDSLTLRNFCEFSVCLETVIFTRNQFDTTSASENEVIITGFAEVCHVSGTK